MKITSRITTSGGVLVTTLIVCVLIGLMLAAYLSMLSNQHKMSQRSQVWNNCIPMAEAGIEEALAHLNHINTTSNFAINGWTSNSGVFYRDRELNGGTMRLAISNDRPPTVIVAASLNAPVQSGSLTRRIRVKTKLNQKFPNGILSKGGIALGGSGKIDSFNSALPGVESDLFGVYNPLLATDRATVVTTATGAGIINVGNMNIYGSIATAPGGTAVLSPNGNVGSKPFNENPLYDGQIEAGHQTDDVNVYIPDAALPSPFGGPLQAPSSGVVDGVSYKHIIGDGDWAIAAINLSSSEKIIITGKARLWVQGTTQTQGQSSITVTTNASVEWYAQRDVSIGGSGVINSPGLAKHFSIIGLNTCLNVAYSGSTKFIGTVYAPHAVVSLTGNSDAAGALVGKSVSLSGGMGLHYDESLKGDPRKNRFIAASWQEF